MSISADVWLGPLLTAHLTSRDGRTIKLRYSPEAVSELPSMAPVLSCSLPLRSGRQDATAFLQGLLPEGHALDGMAREAGVAAQDTLALLLRFGRDVAGALVVTPTGREPTGQISGVMPYHGDGLAQAVDDLDDRPLDLHGDSELSVAGMQNKLLLVRTDHGWARPFGGRPSTHILKRDDPRFPGLVDAEAAALRLAEALDLSDIDPHVELLGRWRSLVVKRFDRRTGPGGATERMHQEDLCQATGTDTTAQRGRAKYEAHGGPSYFDLARLLSDFAADPTAELLRLVRVMVFTVAIGNSDAHGKNLALLHPDSEHVTLAPLYDTVPTALWPTLPKRAAMFVAGVDELPRVSRQHLDDEIRRWPVSTRTAHRTISECVEATHDLAATIGHEALSRFVRDRCEALRH